MNKTNKFDKKIEYNSNTRTGNATKKINTNTNSSNLNSTNKNNKTKREEDIEKEREKELKYYRNKFKINYFEEQNKTKYIANIIKMAKNDLLGEIDDKNKQNIRQMIFASLFGNGTPI